MGRKPLPVEIRKAQFKVALCQSMLAKLENLATEQRISVAEIIRRFISDGIGDWDSHNAIDKDVSANWRKEEIQ